MQLNRQYDIIIIGAGLSGLTSAYYLKKQNPFLSILIIEASEKAGGSVQSVQLKTSKIGSKKSSYEIGSQWISDSQKNIIKLLKEFNLETYEQFKTGKNIIEVNGKQITNASSAPDVPRISILKLLDLKGIKTKFNIGAKRINTMYPFENIHLANHLDSINLDQYLYSNSLSTMSRSIMESTIRTIFGCESTQLNALYALNYLKSSGGDINKLICSQEKKVKGGIDQLTQMILDFVLDQSKNKIIYNTKLIEINQADLNQSDCLVLVENIQTGFKEKYFSKKIISSIPLSQYVNINFIPDLPAYKKNVFNNCQLGNVTKFLITYERAFWREKGFSGQVISDGSIMSINENIFNDFYQNDLDKLSFNKQLPSIGPITYLLDATNANNEPALIGYIAGRPFVEWADQSIELRKGEVIESICRYFGNEARDYLDYIEKNWSDETFLTAYPSTHISAGNVMIDFPRATREPFGNVHFCGSLTIF